MPLRQSQAKPLGRFAAVGLIGFAIDGSILSALVWMDLGVYVARCISFITAVSATWWLNRSWTFAARARANRGEEYRAYVAVQIIGSIINLSIFAAIIQWHPLLRQTPIIPLAAGAAVALVFNYTASRTFVFSVRVDKTRSP